MKRPVAAWLAFFFCSAALMAILAWVSFTFKDLHQAEISMRQQAALEESVRLALWRMETLLAPLLAEENGRPYYSYQAYYSAERAYGRTFAKTGRNEIMIPSPLLQGGSPMFRFYFQISPDGKWSSPQVPSPTHEGTPFPSELQQNSRRVFFQLQQWASRLDREALLPLATEQWLQTETALVREPQDIQNKVISRPEKKLSLPSQMVQNAPAEVAKKIIIEPAEVQQMAQNSQQFNARANSQSSIGNFSSNYVPSSKIALSPETRRETIKVGLLKPIWVKGELLLLRQARVGTQVFLQGAIFDWAKLRTGLESTVREQLPEARLEPATSGTREYSRLLAALPLRLEPGRLINPITQPYPSWLISLAAFWAGALLAILVAAFWLAGVLRLSERRAAFVSAVTHELRTPLTTFCMYTEMLSEGMVSGEEERRQYLDTLRREAIRQTHLVENVLAYSRLERGRLGGQLQWTPAPQLLSPFWDRLESLAERSGLKLELQMGPLASSIVVRVDTAALERIIANLVDNGCKYGHTSETSLIIIRVQMEKQTLAISVIDLGPGVPRAEARHIFRPFAKSSLQAAQSAPGVGLGLALSRRLARAMGGDLRLDLASGRGACFTLRLPAKSRSENC